MKVLDCNHIDAGKYQLVVENDDIVQQFSVMITKELIDDRALLQEKRQQCQHINSRPRFLKMCDGRKYVKRQCLECGVAASPQLKKSEWPEDCEPWDEDLVFRHKYEEWELYLKHYFIQRDTVSTEAAQYGKYLRSPEWRRKRKLALERDNYLCQGCRVKPATQVHHLTYSHIFAEFLFELVSVCDECHEKIHSVH